MRLSDTEKNLLIMGLGTWVLLNRSGARCSLPLSKEASYDRKYPRHDDPPEKGNGVRREFTLPRQKGDRSYDEKGQHNSQDEVASQRPSCGNCLALDVHLGDVSQPHKCLLLCFRRDFCAPPGFVYGRIRGLVGVLRTCCVDAWSVIYHNRRYYHSGDSQSTTKEQSPEKGSLATMLTYPMYPLILSELGGTLLVD